MHLVNLVAKCVFWVVQHSECEDLSEALSRRAISTDEEAVLRVQGYSVEQLHLWVNALLEEDSVIAAQHITSSTRLDGVESIIPHFILLTVFRRKHITTQALRMLVDHVNNAWALPHSRPVVKRRFFTGTDQKARHDTAIGQVSVQDVLILEHSLFLYHAFTQLIRHARQVWPQCLEAIAQQWTILVPTSARTAQAPPQQRAILSFLHNRFLFLLSEPSTSQPYKNIAYHAAAQGTCLQHMASANPTIDLSHEGYRGVLRVQLAHRKTMREAEWGTLKTASWPPWKEDRTGIDALIGLEYGISRAGQVLNRIHEAGYAPTTAEEVSKIYTGWDTDHTPTIQTRTMLRHLKVRRGDPSIWAARIRATRTIKEAWACFLAHQDAGLLPDHKIYLAMFEKLHHKEQRPHRSAGSISRHDPYQYGLQTTSNSHLQRTDESAEGEDEWAPILPGDLPEVFPSPSSLHQETYTRTEPPSVEQLFSQMRQQGLVPDECMLQIIIANVSSWSFGLQVFSSCLHGPLSDWLENYLSVAERTEWHDKLPGLVAALIQLLTRFPKDSRQDPTFRGLHERNLSLGPWTLNARQPLVVHYQLLVALQSQESQAWNDFWKALAHVRDTFPIVYFEKDHFDLPDVLGGHVNVMVAMQLARHHVIPRGEGRHLVDQDGFLHICIIASKAADAALDIQNRHDRGFIKAKPDLPRNSIEMIVNEAANILAQGNFLRDQFYQLVGIRSAISPVADANLGMGAANALHVLSRESDVGEVSISEQHAQRSLFAPRLDTVPNPAMLHAYMRGLGAFRNFEAILELFTWMQEYWPELSERGAKDRSGRRMMRRVLVAARVYLQFGSDLSRQTIDDDRLWQELVAADERESVDDEGPDRGTDHDDVSTWSAPESVVNGVLQIAHAMREQWGPWPTAKEVLVYIETGREQHMKR